MSRIEFLKEEKRSIIIYESPHRIKRLIEELKAVFEVKDWYQYQESYQKYIKKISEEP